MSMPTADGQACHEIVSIRPLEICILLYTLVTTVQYWHDMRQTLAYLVMICIVHELCLKTNSFIQQPTQTHWP